MLDNLLRLAENDAAAIESLAWMLVAWGWTFLSATLRLLGLFVLSPVFGQRGVSVWLRVCLAVCLAAVVTPMLIHHGSATTPTSEWDALAQLSGEFVIGALLGFGVLFLFAGLRLAGELIDQQAGAAVVEVFDPNSGQAATATGSLLTMVGTLTLLSLTPGQGHLLIVAALFDSFLVIPTDTIWSDSSVVSLLYAMGQASLTLGLRVAAPMLAAGAIVSWGLSTLSGPSGSPYAASLLGVPMRIVVSLGILVMCLSGATETLLTALENVLHQFPDLLSGG